MLYVVALAFKALSFLNGNFCFSLIPLYYTILYYSKANTKNILLFYKNFQENFNVLKVIEIFIKKNNKAILLLIY